MPVGVAVDEAAVAQFAVVEEDAAAGGVGVEGAVGDGDPLDDGRGVVDQEDSAGGISPGFRQACRVAPVE